jgi:hypothetical protein
MESATDTVKQDDNLKRSRIIAAFAERGWELRETREGGSWTDEILMMASTLPPVGQQLVLTFLVDPQHEGPRARGEHVYAVAATRDIRPDRATANDARLLTLGKGWEARLPAFVLELDVFRR